MRGGITAVFAFFVVKRSSADERGVTSTGISG
jgi:hypothetical protein